MADSSAVSDLSEEQSFTANDELLEIIAEDKEEIIYDEVMNSGIGPLQALFGPEIINETTCPIDVMVSGSSAERLKLYLKQDIGDVDIMISPRNFLISEMSLEYKKDNPLFVHILAEYQPIEIKQFCFLGKYIHTRVLRDVPVQIFGHWTNIMPLVIKMIEMQGDAHVDYPKEDDEAVAKTFEMKQNYGTVSEQIEKDELIPRGRRRVLDVLFSSLSNIHGLPYNETLLDTIESAIDKASHSKEPRINKIKRIFTTGKLDELLKKQGLMPNMQQLSSFFAQPSQINTTLKTDKSDRTTVAMPSLVKVPCSRYRPKESSSQHYSDENWFDNDLDCCEMGIDENNISGESRVSDRNSAIDPGGPHSKIIEQWKEAGMDLVPALKLISWPHSALGWISRKRNWPDRTVVDKVVTLGCHLVAKSPPFNKNLALDFRLSFSEAEILLSHSLDPKMKKCYRAVKMLLKAMGTKIGEKKTLISFHIKTSLYWFCEKMNPDFWEKDLLSVVREFLIFIKQRIEERFLGQYFVPETNLFAHLSPEWVDELRGKFDRAIEDPVGELRIWRENSKHETRLSSSSCLGEEAMTDPVVFRAAYDQICEELIHSLMSSRYDIQDFGDLTGLVQRFRLWKAQWNVEIKRFKMMFKLEEMFSMAANGSIVSDASSYRQLVIDGLEHTLPYVESLLDDVRRTGCTEMYTRNKYQGTNGTLSPEFLPQVAQHMLNYISNGMQVQKPKPSYQEEGVD